ncbi:peptide-O-fucosyltransferase [Paragonimus westermani]|uniref:GDP-fucose protein O-fucosyltransferase 2 n=1 Tax=Paragonimus westermani TaxID=34504 RepID=A0A5J4P0E2_9TREM|nr:peptide-O-fucosyltransferase [Paragonimus westermani]
MSGFLPFIEFTASSPQMGNLGLSVIFIALIHLANCTGNYILYDVFQGEGFNLRRDVYIRMANLVRLLRRSALEYDNDISNWTLVLPPWGPLPHWMAAYNRFDRKLKGESSEVLRADFIGIPWSQYFDLSSLSQVLPVLEFSDFLRSIQNAHPDSAPTVDLALHLIPDHVLGLSQKERGVKFCADPIRNLYTTFPSSQGPPFHLFPHLSSNWGLEMLFAARYDCITGDLEAKLLAPFIGRLINESKSNTRIRSQLRLRVDVVARVQNAHPDSAPTVDLALHLIPDHVLGLSQKERGVKFCADPIRNLYTTFPSSQGPPFHLFPHLSSNWGLEMLFAARYDCITGDLEAKLLAPFIGRLINESKSNTRIRSIYVNSAESIIHGHFSEWSQEYWTVRRSMVFSLRLRQLGDDFRMRALNSSDIPDRTLPPSPVPGRTNSSHWLRPHWPLAPAIGGPYVAVHWRCGDYVSASANPWANTPSPRILAEQILHVMELVNSNSSVPITKVFLSTDGSETDVAELKERIAPLQMVRFIPNAAQWEQHGPGGLAIVDQWVSAHARWFIGTNPSTFTFRITEERTIMGFPFVATFNALCAKGGARLYAQPMSLASKRDGCEALTAWPVMFEDEFTAVDPLDSKLLHTEL